MAEIITHVVAAERQHRHRVAAHFTNRAGRRSGHLRTHRRAHVDAARPVEGLVDQRHRRRAAATENKGTDRHAIGIFPLRVDGRTLLRGRSEPRVRMRGLGSGGFRDFRRPDFPLPIGRRRRRLRGHTFPPDAPAGSQRNIGEDGILRERGHRVGIGLVRRAGGYTEETSLGIDRAQAPLSIGLDPRDIVADGPDLPALFLKMRGRDEHGEVRLATGAGKGRCHIGLLPLRILHPQNEHVLRHPALVTRHRRRDAQRKAFFSEERITTVAGTVAPDLARLREVHDVFFFVSRPSDILLPLRQRRTDRMDTRHHALKILVDQLEDFFADARHNAHIDDDVGRIRELNPDLRHGRPDWPHAERQHIHGAAPHTAREEPLERLPHLERIDPIIRRPRGLLGERADVSAILDPGHVVRIRAGEITMGPLLLVEFNERAAGHHLSAQGIILALRAINPVDRVGLAQLGHFFDPAQQVLIRAEGRGGVFL